MLELPQPSSQYWLDLEDDKIVDLNKKTGRVTIPFMVRKPVVDQKNVKINVFKDINLSEMVQ